MKRKVVFAVVALIILSLLFWRFNPLRGQEVEVIAPKTSAAIQAVYATGTVEASLMIPISPKVGARLMSLETDEGAKVEKGQVLAQLEDTDIRQTLTELQAKLDLADKDLKRAQALSKTGALSKEVLEQSQANYETAAAGVDRTKAELSYLQLLAPEDGVIIKRDGEIGELISVGTPVFWMTGGEDLRIETEVDEEDISLVQPGQRVVISADAYPNQIFEGKVQSITPKGDPVARSYRVRVTFAQQTPLMIGMTAETNIITKEKDKALMVPVAAVSNGNVVKIVGHTASIVKVETGIKTPQSVEILSGVTQGDQIAKAFDSTLVNGNSLHAKVTDWTPAKTLP